MPFCKKGTLIELIISVDEKGKKISPRLILYLFKQMLECLDFLHNKNRMAQLDFKPDNIVIRDDYTLSLIDFGHTKPIEKPLYSVVGTEEYMAPEMMILRSFGLTPEYLKKRAPQICCNSEKVDIFAMGVSLFTLIFGYPPFELASRRDPLY